MVPRSMATGLQVAGGLLMAAGIGLALMAAALVLGVQWTSLPATAVSDSMRTIGAIPSFAGLLAALGVGLFGLGCFAAALAAIRLRSVPSDRWDAEVDSLPLTEDGALLMPIGALPEPQKPQPTPWPTPRDIVFGIGRRLRRMLPGKR